MLLEVSRVLEENLREYTGEEEEEEEEEEEGVKLCKMKTLN